MRHHRRYRIWGSVAAGVVLSLVTTATVAAIALRWTPLAADTIPLPLLVAIPVTPLLVPGLLVRREERLVRRRDGDFPQFIRALGSVESVKQSSTANVLSTLRRKDFGALTDDINGLYRRLNIRIDAERAWRLFAADTGSWLIQKFADMYVVGRGMGGSPKRLGSLISANINTMLKLREQREQATTTLIGIVYGLSAASIFAAFIGLEIVVMLVEVSESVTVDDPLIAGLFNPDVYDVRFIEWLLLCVVLLNALLSALMIRLTDRGRYLNSLAHFVLLTWTGAFVALITREAVGSLIVLG